MKIKKIESIIDAIKEPIMEVYDDFSSTVKSRREICYSCPKVKLNAIHIHSCSLCGCPIASKTLVPNTHCPDVPSKW